MMLKFAQVVGITACLRCMFISVRHAKNTVVKGFWVDRCPHCTCRIKREKDRVGKSK